MMPYIARQRELPNVHDHPSPGATQFLYHSVPQSPNYPPQQQPLYPRYQLQPNRPLFRTQSTSAVASQSHTNEHMLRRKTPQGTLPDAYDAAPVEWAMRPTKHMILPYTPSNAQAIEPQFHDAAVQTVKPIPWPKDLTPAAGALRLRGMESHPGSPPQFSSGWAHHNDGYGVPGPVEESLDPFVRQFLQQNQHQMAPPPLITTDQAWMSCQPLGFQAMYNPITPPTASCDEVNGYLMGDNYTGNTWPARYSTWDPGQSTPSSQLGDAVNSMHLDSHYRPDIWPQESRLLQTRPPLLHHSRRRSVSNINFSHTPLLPDPTLRSLQLPPASAPIFSGQPSALSKESVAVMAHKAYVDLLSSIQAQQRSEAGSSGNGSSAIKPHLFPRPPSVSAARAALRQRRSSYIISGGNMRSPVGNVDGLDRQKQPRSSTGYFPAINVGGYHSPVGPLSAHQSPMGATGYPFPILDGTGMADGSGRMLSIQAQSPMQIPSDSYIASAIPRHLNGLAPSLSPISPVSAAPSSLLTPAAKQFEAFTQATTALPVLENMCVEYGWTWIDGMLLGGCLAYALGDLSSAINWFRRVLAVDDGHVEALSNLASTFLSQNRREEAERYWRIVVKKRPSHFEAVEHLVGLLCGDHRGKEAVEIINFVENSLRRQPDISQAPNDVSEFMAGAYARSPFNIPGSDNGRMVALIHAKGNMLYTLGDNVGAAKAFEEAVLVAADVHHGGIATLINRILVVLKAATDNVNVSEVGRNPPQAPVLLAPDKAVQTARLVFPPDGQLPGLREVPKGSAEKAAVSTTSNSLLSLAKIFQDGMSTGGGAAGRYGATVKDILALYYLSLALHESPSTANNVGILLASIQQSTTSTASSGSVPEVPGAGPSAGINLALQYYNYGLRLDNNHAHLYTNLGSLLKDINQLPLAIDMYERAVKCDGTFDIALANLANAVKDQGRISDAIEYYRRAVKANPDFAEAVCGLANALNSVCDWKGRGGIVRDGGNRDRWHVDDHGMLKDARTPNSVSHGWMKRVVEIVEKQLKQGESWGLRVLGTDQMLDRFLSEIMAAQGGKWPSSRMAYLRREVSAWIGQPYEGAKIIRLIERASQRTVWRWYHDKYTRGIEKPQEDYRRPSVPPSLTTPSAPTVLPFHTFTCPLSAKQVRLISERNGLRISCSTLRSSWLPPTVYPPPAPPRPYLRVGYISSDFNNHPLAHLMQSVFGLHDRTRVKAYCYATTASDGSEHRKQIERESPVFYNAHSWGPDRLIQQIVNDGIHILINLNGFTRGARNEIFAARPAPIQMSFMGFAGTLGAEWCDYLYADTTAVPTNMLRPHRDNVTVEDAVEGFKQSELDNWVYAENIIYARYSFFCCDHRQSAPDAGMRRFTWEQEKARRWEMRKQLFPQLQDDQIILGNFNQLYKIEPTTFRTWLKILAACPKAVLWLLRFPDLGQRNLTHLATLWAGESVASRIIFTDVAPKPQHISRAQVCDLFLDTPECNAHTTAADVLWSGTPLLTLPRHQHKMCSRIAASILRAAVPQTPEGKAMADKLVVSSEEEYQTRAVELVEGLRYGGGGRGEGDLLDARRMLWEGRWINEAFDTKRWVRDLEDAYWAAWRKWEKGEGGDVWLRDLPVGK